MVRLGPWLLVATLFALVLPVSPAYADFRVCNKTDAEVGVAAGRHNDKGWESRGWWNVMPGDCAVIFPGPLTNRYYYLHARHYDVGGTWDGDFHMCISEDKFTIQGEDQCEERGYDSVGFFEVDTVDAIDGWTQDLVE